MSDGPHASWAEVYDLVYEQTFGDAYANLTEATVRAVCGRIRPPAKLVDFGAGTGRLSIPLARLGFEVTAVDPCGAMLDQLKRKSESAHVRTVVSRMEDFAAEEEFDGGLCMFTVLIYLLDEPTLERALRAAHAALKPGGLLFLDVPPRRLFSGYSVENDFFERDVFIGRVSGEIFEYRENIVLKGRGGQGKIYRDAFFIRYWPLPAVWKILRRAGFEIMEDIEELFECSGSHYMLLRKPS